MLERDINHSQNLCRLAWGAMNVVLHNAVVEYRVTLKKRIGFLAIDNLHLTLHHIDELLTLMGRELELRTVLRININDERLHVTTGFLLSQGVILHVLAGIGSTIREADTALKLTFCSTAHDWSQSIVVIHKCTQPYTKCTGYLDQRA